MRNNRNVIDVCSVYIDNITIQRIYNITNNVDVNSTSTSRVKPVEGLALK